MQAWPVDEGTCLCVYVRDRWCKQPDMNVFMSAAAAAAGLSAALVMMVLQGSGRRDQH